MHLVRESRLVAVLLAHRISPPAAAAGPPEPVAAHDVDESVMLVRGATFPVVLLGSRHHAAPKFSSSAAATSTACDRRQVMTPSLVPSGMKMAAKGRWSPTGRAASDC